MEQSHKTFSFKGKKNLEIHFPFFFLDGLYRQVSVCCRCWRCCMPPSVSPCFSSYFPPTPSTQPPLPAHTLFQPPSSIQTEIQPHQTSVWHEGIYFYFSLEPLPPEYLTRFHTSSHLQSLTETQSSCLSSIIQNNLMSAYLPPFICIQFLPRNLIASIYVRQRSSLFIVHVWDALPHSGKKHVEPMYCGVAVWLTHRDRHPTKNRVRMLTFQTRSDSSSSL